MPWLALTAAVDRAHAEALSDALLEGGAQSVSIDGVEGERPEVSALLAVDADAAEVLRRAAELAALPRVLQYTLARVADEDWVRCSQAQFSPITIGERLWIGPSWHKPPAGIEATVCIDPGLAFGTGSHPSTRLALRFVERRVREGQSLLDYGCGSGILAIAAAKLGAGPIAAVDIDTQALEVTAANALANGVSLLAADPQALPAGRYDIVVSNILAGPLIELAPVLAERSAPGGKIALSGLLDSQAADVAEAYVGLFDMRSSAEAGWALLEGVRR